MSQHPHVATDAAPVFACTLPPPELRKRRVEVLTAVRRRATRVEELPNGFVLTLPHQEGLEEELGEFIRFEAACCAFIAMSVTRREGGIELRMTSEGEGKTFIRAEFIDVLEAHEASSGPACGCGAPKSAP